MNADYIKTFCNNISSVFGSLIFAKKRFVLREILEKIVINGDMVTIHGIVPDYEEGSRNVLVASLSS